MPRVQFFGEIFDEIFEDAILPSALPYIGLSLMQAKLPRLVYSSAFCAICLLLINTIPALSAPAEVKGSQAAKSGAAAASGAKTYPNTVLGDWSSEWGPVKFEKTGETISGQWLEGKGKDGKDQVGKIEKGVFDEKAGTFNYNFTETWTGKSGKAELKLSADHSQLSGNWVRGKDKGTWSMKRSAK